MAAWYGALLTPRRRQRSAVLLQRWGQYGVVRHWCYDGASDARPCCNDGGSTVWCPTDAPTAPAVRDPTATMVAARHGAPLVLRRCQQSAALLQRWQPAEQKFTWYADLWILRHDSTKRTGSVPSLRIEDVPLAASGLKECLLPPAHYVIDDTGWHVVLDATQPQLEVDTLSSSEQPS